MHALPAADRCIAGADPRHWERVRSTAEATGSHFVLGVHPWFDAEPQLFDEIAAFEPDGFGEIGLDGARPHPRQSDTARFQLERTEGRPVVLHCVRAHDALLALVKATGVRNGFVHAWTGSTDQALRFVEQGLHISFGPALLRSNKVQQAALRVPDERILVETDGETLGDLGALDSVLECLAGLRAVSIEHLTTQTAANARRLFPRPVR